MAKYVIAGKSDCPYYAKVELLADELNERLNDFKVHKIVVSPGDWDSWVKSTCSERKWSYDGRSPLIWRELIDRGGKGILVGSCSDFLEIASGYYGLKSDKMTDELLKIAQENKDTKIKDDEKAVMAEKGKSSPLKVCITCASNGVCYQLLLPLCNFKVFKDVEEVSICLLDAEDKHGLLQGATMEVIDSAPSQLRDISVTSNMQDAFKSANLIIILDTLEYEMKRNGINDPSFSEMVRQIDFSKIKEYGETISEVADENVKVLVVGGPSNIACNILIAASQKNNSSKDFYTLARLDENKAKNVIAQRLNVKTADIENVVVWGQPDFQQVTDVNMSRVIHYDGAIWGPHIPGFSQDTKELVHDEQWLANELPELTFKNDIELRKLRGKEPSFNVAAAVLEQVHDLYDGSGSDGIYCIGTASKGWYDIPEGLVFSVPARFNQGQVEVVSELELPEETIKRVKEMAQQLKVITDEILHVYGMGI